jgi:uncharacterized lipoprotein YddW (UPF0748 family)
MRRRVFLADAARAAAASLAAAQVAACQGAAGSALSTASGTASGTAEGTGGGGAHAAAGGCAPTTGRRQLRATWIASFKNLDWPSRPGLPAVRQRAELAGLLDQAARLRLNAVLLQVRPAADALYQSAHEPWSRWLTGTPGGSPGYDPLAFAVAAAHDRGLELHAWFNPYRVSERPGRWRLAAGSPAARHPDWVVEYGGQLWYDPGHPAPRELAITVISDVAARYDIDGVHLDDYFYPYPAGGQPFDDSRTFRRYGGGFAGRADWRRRNIDLLIAGISAEIRRLRPSLWFGVSPFGIWRNAATDPAGSRTSGLQAYDDLYADVRGWVRRGLLDYVAPQLYWEIANPAAPYEELVRWWSGVVAGSPARLFIGQAAYRAGHWPDPREMARHLAFDASESGVSGEIFFHARSLAPGGPVARLTAGAFTARARPPVPKRLQVKLPSASCGPGMSRWRRQDG